MSYGNFRQSSLRSSYVIQSGQSISMKKSYISTATVNDQNIYGEQLRKSRIQNLPNYKKTNLGDNLQFIVVFQTIQIERLSNQIEILRVKIKENERQLFNYQSYEVQIRELTEQVNSLLSEREEYRQQIDKLTKVCQTLYHENQTLQARMKEIDYSIKQKYESERQKNQELMNEIEKWKNRYQATERSKTKDLDDLRNMMQSQRKSMIDREIMEINMRFQNQRSQLESQIRKSREMLENKNRDCDDLRQKIQRYEISMMELRNYQTIIHDFENKTVLLNQQLLRLNDLLKSKDEELHEYKQRQFNLTRKLKEQDQWEHQNKQLRTTLNHRLKEIQEWKIRTISLEEEASKAKEMLHYNEEMSNKLMVSSKEIDRLNGLLRAKLDEINSWKEKYSRKEMELSKLKNMEDQIAKNQSKFGMMHAENDRLSGLLRSKQSEIQDWKGRYSKIQAVSQNYSYLETQKNNLFNKLNQKVREGQQMSFQIVNLQKQLKISKQLQNQNRQLQRQRNQLGKQIERLNGIIRNHSNELNDFKQRYVKLEASIGEYREVELRIKQSDNKIMMLATENQRLNQLIRIRNNEIEQLQHDKLEMHTQINHYKNYEIKINEIQMEKKRLHDQINGLKENGGNWERKVRDCEGRIGEMERFLFQSNKEKQKLSNMLKHKTNEYENVRGQFAQLEAEYRRIAGLDLTCQEQHNQIMQHVDDKERMASRLKQYQMLLEKEGSLVNELSFRVIVLSAEVQRLAGGGGGSGGMKTREFQEMKESYSHLKSKVISKNNQIDILLSKINSLESQVGELAREFNRLLEQAMKSQKETRMLFARIQDYQEYAKKIHILSAEIDRLQAENKAYDEDARKIRLKYADGFAQEKKYQDFNFMMVLMAVELESLRSRLDQRQIKQDQMRKSILEPIRRV